MTGSDTEPGTSPRSGNPHEEFAPGLARRELTILSPARLSDVLGSLRLGRFGGVIVLAIIVAIFSIMQPSTFLTTTTAVAVAQNQAITAMVSLSLMICLIAGAFDVSVAQNLGLGSVICISLLSGHTSVLVAVIITVAVCAAAGLLNAMLVVGIGINSFVATLGTSSVLLAVNELVSNDQDVGPTRPSFQNLTSWHLLGVPAVAIYSLGFLIVAWYVLEHTPVGRRLHATGSNIDAARLAGIPTRRYTAMAFLVTGLGAGITAVIWSSSVGSVNPTDGSNYLLPAFAGCFLAATQIKPGRYNVGGLIVGLVLLGTGIEGLGLIDDTVWIPDLFNGVALIAAVGASVVLQRQQLRRSKMRAEGDQESLPRSPGSADANPAVDENRLAKR